MARKGFTLDDLLARSTVKHKLSNGNEIRLYAPRLAAMRRLDILIGEARQRGMPVLDYLIWKHTGIDTDLRKLYGSLMREHKLRNGKTIYIGIPSMQRQRRQLRGGLARTAGVRQTRQGDPVARLFTRRPSPLTARSAIERLREMGYEVIPGVDIVFVNGVPVSRRAITALPGLLEHGKIKYLTVEDQIQRIIREAERRGQRAKVIQQYATPQAIQQYCSQNPNGILIYKSGTYFGNQAYQAAFCTGGRATTFYTITPRFSWQG